MDHSSYLHKSEESQRRQKAPCTAGRNVAELLHLRHENVTENKAWRQPSATRTVRNVSKHFWLAMAENTASCAVCSSAMRSRGNRRMWGSWANKRHTHLLQQQRFVLSGREWHLVVNIDRGIFIVGVDLRVCDDPVTMRHSAPALLHLVRQQAVVFCRGGARFNSNRTLRVPGVELEEGGYTV